MISEKAVEALCSEYFEKHGVSLDRANARAALSAALPLLLEGKREEIARVIEPGAWGVYDQCVRDLDHPYLDQKVVIKAQIVSSLDRADRIIAMLGGGE